MASAVNPQTADQQTVPHKEKAWEFFRSMGSPKFHVAPMVDQVRRKLPGLAVRGLRRCAKRAENPPTQHLAVPGAAEPLPPRASTSALYPAALREQADCSEARSQARR